MIANRASLNVRCVVSRPGLRPFDCQAIPQMVCYSQSNPHRKNQMTPQDAQAFLDENFAPWVRALDLTFTDLGQGTATATMPITDQTTRMGDILSGQALAAMADTIMVFACFAHYGEVKPVATTNLDTVFLRPGVGTHIRCEAEVVRAGKALLFTKATMFAEPSGKAVATATATFYLA